MLRLDRIWRGALLVSTICLSLLNLRASASADEILVSAAASLTDVLREIGKGYQAKSRNTVQFNFGPSSGLARQIEEGAPADMFFSADLSQMAALQAKGLIESGSQRNLLSNQLVIIVPLDSRLLISSPKRLLETDIRKIALAEPSSVPAGVYTRKYLVEEGLWSRVESKIIPVQDVRATLAAVESGNVDAGIVYKTDAAISEKVKIAYEIPVDKAPRITYPVAILKESNKKTAARDFLNYLSGPAARNSFQKYGFSVLD